MPASFLYILKKFWSVTVARVCVSSLILTRRGCAWPRQPVQPVAPLPTVHQPARELVDDDDGHVAVLVPRDGRNACRRCRVVGLEGMSMR